MDPKLLALLGLDTSPLQQNVPITQPSQVEEPAPPVPAAPMVPQSQQQSGSFRGVTDQGLQQARKVFSGVDGRVQRDAAPLEAQAEQNLQGLNTARQSLYDAQNEQARLTQEHQSNLSKLKEEESEFHRGAAALEQQMSLETQAESERYIGAFREQIAAVRAMAVDPTGPIASLTTAQAGGLSLAMFAQGFLGAQGIKVDVAGQLDRWVDRSIAEQQRRIQQAEKGAQDQLNLWQLARQSSQDELEARNRYRGMVIAGMMAATEAKAAQFNSGLAMSKAKEANAQLSLQLGAIERQIQDGYFTKLNTIKKTEYDRAYQQGQLAQQSKQLAETTRHNKAIEGASKAQSRGAPISDPEAVEMVDEKGQKRKVLVNRWEHDPAKGADAAKAANNARNAWDLYTRDFERLVQLHEEVFNDPKTKIINGVPMLGGGLAGRVNPKFSEYKALKSAFTRSQLRIESGLTVTDQEWKEMQARFPEEKLIQVGDKLETWFSMKEQAREKFEATMNTYAKPYGAPSAAPGVDQPYVLPPEASPRAAQDWRNIKGGTAPETSPIAKTVTDATEKTSTDDVGTQNRAFARFEETLRQKNDDRTFGIDQYPEYAKPMEKLALAALNPEVVAKEFGSDDDPAQLKADALAALNTIASDKKVPSDRREYAKYLVQRAMEDTEALLEDLQVAAKDYTPKFE